MKRPPLIRLRGIRQVVPSGHVIGRVSPGAGDAELIPLSWLTQANYKTGAAPLGVPGTVSLGWFFRGPMQPNKLYYGATSLNPGVFPGTGITQYAYAETAPGINFALGIYIEGTGLIGTVTWAGGVKTATVAYSAPVTIPALARVYILAPNLADGEIRNATVLLTGDAA